MNRKLTATLVSTAVAMFLMGILVGAQFNRYIVTETFKLPHGVFTVEVYRADGTLVLHEEHSNLVTNIGKRHVRNLMAFLNSSIIQGSNKTVSLSLSSDTTPQATWTKLPNEYTAYGLDRKGPSEVTVTIINSTAYSTSYEWTCTADGKVVCCVGVHWWDADGSDGNLYAAGTFTSVTLNTGDKIKVTYTLNFN